MISLSPTLPPIEHDNALRLAMIYLSAAADPAGTKARLDELATQTQALRDAIAANEAAAAKASEVEAAQEAVAAREADVQSREESLLRANTQLSVANHANASREDGLNLREQALDRRAAEIEARAKALEDRLAAYRQALA